MTYFTNRWDYSKEPQKVSASDAILYAINHAPAYHDGALEELRAKMDAVTDVLMSFIKVLTDEQQADIIESLGQFEIYEEKP